MWCGVQRGRQLTHGRLSAAQVWVLDSMVGRAKLGAEEPTDVQQVIQEVARIPLPVPSRAWVGVPALSAKSM